MTDRRRLMNEGPTVVGLLTSVIESGGSLDGAARIVADEGPPLSRELFGRAVRRADTKGAPGVKDALAEEVSELDGEASGYRQAVMLCICASESGDGKERLATLREASDVALDAVRIMGERYSESLTVPCTTVFALGILLPMILMSIAPMMGIGGMFGTAAIDSGMMSAAILVAIPAVILAITWTIRRGNPFIGEHPAGGGVRGALPLLAVVPIYAAMVLSGHGPEESMAAAIVPPCAACILLLVSGERESSAMRRAEAGLRDSVFELGNLLLRGENFEKVSVEAVSSRKECANVAEALGRELDLCRGDVPSALSEAVGPVSPEVTRTLQDIYRCSQKDTEEAGGLAIAVGRQYQNSDNIRKELDLRTKSMRDMMIGTAVLFAPLILGMSVSMLEPLSGIAGYQAMDGTGTMVTVYLVELCALIAVLTTGLGEGGDAGKAAWRFSVMAPIALAVYAVCSSVQLFRPSGASVSSVECREARIGRNILPRSIRSGPMHVAIGRSRGSCSLPPRSSAS